MTKHRQPFWELRPDEVQKAIDAQFKKLANNTLTWGLYNGKAEYFLANIKEQFLIKKMIEEEYKSKGRCEFYLMDIGAGEFSWSDAMAYYLNNELNLPDDVLIHIIGIRAEKNPEKPILNKGRCKIYNFGEFKLENMITEFDIHQLKLENKMDYIVSRACLEHLVDPVGTFAQAYELLRPQTGYFAFSDFSNFVINDIVNDIEIRNHSALTSIMLLEANIEFLVHSSRTSYSNDFIIQKKNSEPCKINLSYSQLSKKSSEDLAANVVTIFTPLDQNKRCFLEEILFLQNNNEWDGAKLYLKDTQVVDEEEINPPRARGMYGSKSMHEFFKQNRLLIEPNFTWYSICANKRDHEYSFKLHEAIKKGDSAEVQSCLDKTNINESDYNGNTPTHLAIQKNRFEIFKLLLTFEPHLDLFNNEGRDAFLEAIKWDKKGDYIQLLIQIGACINPGERFHRDNIKPLDYAKDEKNRAAIKLICKAQESLAFFKVEPKRTLYQNATEIYTSPNNKKY